MSAHRVTLACEAGGARAPLRRGVYLLVALAILGAACSEGYSTKDVSSISPSEMTRAELVANINSLGAHPGLDRRWQYELSAACQLKVTATAGEIFRSSQTTTALLKNADIKMRSVEGNDKFDVRVLQSAANATPDVGVLEGARWALALQMKASLEHLRARCERDDR